MSPSRSVTEHTFNRDERDPAALAFHAGAADRDGVAGVCASIVYTRATCRSSCVTPISPPARADAPWRAPRNWTPRFWKLCASCSAPTGNPGARCACWELQVSLLESASGQMELLASPQERG